MNRVVRALLYSIWLLASSGHAADDVRYTVFSEHVNQLSAMQDLYDTAAKELKETDSNGKMATMIRNGTRIKLELSRNIAMLKANSAPPPYEFITPNVIHVYEKKIELHEMLIEIASQFIGGPKPNVDYGKMAAEMPKITAMLEYADKTLYTVTPAFCLMLVDDRADSKGHLTHLVITKAERKKVLKHIDAVFGKRLLEKNPSYNVGSVVLIKKFLQGKHLSADDPW